MEAGWRGVSTGDRYLQCKVMGLAQVVRLFCDCERNSLTSTLASIYRRSVHDTALDRYAETH